jgi:hypothetical protein
MIDVLLEELPASVQSSIEAYVGCVAGASLKRDYLQMIEDAGFEDMHVLDETAFIKDVQPDDPMLREILSHVDVSADELHRLGKSVVSIKIRAFKAPLTN